MKKLTLFDVDGTLLGSAETHHRAFCKAFKEIYGVDVQPSEIVGRSGMTDQQVIYDVLKEKGFNRNEVKEKIEKYMELMVNLFEEMEKDVEVLPGVQKLLRKLKEHNVLTGLVTGNLEPIARGKLKKVDLNNYFKFGGFESDKESREELVSLVINRAESNFHFQFKENKNVYHFGDTPYDVRAGNQNNAITMAILTGTYSREELKKSGADFIFESLESTDQILERIIR